MSEVGSTSQSQTHSAQQRRAQEEARTTQQSSTSGANGANGADSAQATRAQSADAQAVQASLSRDTFDRSAPSAAATLGRNGSVPEAGPQPSDGFLRELYGAQSPARDDAALSASVARNTSNRSDGVPTSSQHQLAGHNGNEHGGHQHGGHQHGTPSQGRHPSPGQTAPPSPNPHREAPRTEHDPAPGATPEPARVSRGPNGQTVVDLPNGNDNVRVRQDPDGSVHIDQYAPGQATDGSEGGPAHSTRIPPEQAGNLRINGNDGDDNIEVDDSVTHGLTIDGGRGNDRIIGGSGDDHLIGGDGNDHIEGRGGNDRIEGGAGNDQLYGGQGNDHIDGGDGNDFIHGGDGDDMLLGGRGNDQLFGGRGNDRLIGGDGDDVLAGGEGNDIMDGGRGRDRVYVEGDDRVAHDRNDRVTRMGARGNLGHSIRPQGSQRFQERMRDDLDALASTPQGRQLLQRLDATGRTTRISEGRGAALQWDGDIPKRSSLRPDGSRGPGVDPHVQMQDTGIYLDGADHLTPSAVVLAHELAHAYDMATGQMNTTMTKNPGGAWRKVAAYERDAVGLPHDAGPRPSRPSENDIRRDWNMPRRRWY